MRWTTALAIAVAAIALGGCEAIDDFRPFHVVNGDGASGAADLATAADLTASTDLARLPDGGPSSDGATGADMTLPDDGGAPGTDMAVLVSRFSIRGGTSGLGGGRSTGGAFVVSGSIGIPQSRVVSTGGSFTLLPLIPVRH